MFGRLFFFFEQKTAYDMRMSDWRSDVCSADLAVQRIAENAADGDAVEATGRDRRIRRIRAGLDGAGGQWSLAGLQDVLQAWKPNARARASDQPVSALRGSGAVPQHRLITRGMRRALYYGRHQIGRAHV